MALIDVNFYSNALNRQVTYKAIIPIDGPVFPGMPERERTNFKTLYLLHGVMGDYTGWVVSSRVAQLAAEHNIAIIMPSGENSFYVDQPPHHLFGRYIGRELVEETRKLFPLSNRREDTYIGGLSMGGYGALRNGLKYHQTFGAVAGLSSAIITGQARTATEEAGWVFARRSYYETVFGDISKIKGSDKDLEALVEVVKQSGVMPRLYLACGTEDFLLQNNRQFIDYLKKEQIEHTYVEGKGAHDWAFWDEYIEKVLVWLVQQQ